ncbi:hypothetical protein BDW22DRAFT_1362087 [Trametopsis cervina]|nr:hypothetical protein BDW22DRAFT_1362087 [Trametopsis cervina]
MSFRKILATVAAVPLARKFVGRHSGEEESSLHSQAHEPLIPPYDTADGRQFHRSSYGSVQDVAGPSSARSSRRASPEIRRQESTLDRVPEEGYFVQDSPGGSTSEESEELDWDLRERGLYYGSYRRVVVMYTFVPLASLLLLAFLAYCPTLFWAVRYEKPQKYAPYFASPIPELVLSASLWSFAYLLRVPSYAAVSYALQRCSPFLSTLLFNMVYVAIYNLLRLSSLPILRVRDRMKHSRPSCHDSIFRTVWWISLGWAAIDVAVGIVQSYTQISLYRNVMIPAEQTAEILAQGSGIESQTPHLVTASQEILPLSPRNEGFKQGTATSGTLDEAIRLAVDQDLEQLINLKDREDVEEIYGMPVINIPIFVSCLQRMASILLSVGITLIMSASYLQSALSTPAEGLLSLQRFSPKNKFFAIAFPIILLLNLFLNLLHTPLILPRIGVHSTAYISFILGLGSFFVGLGLWGALS